MKKFLALALALVLVLSALAGCGKNETTGGSGPDKERPVPTAPSAPKDRPTAPIPDDTMPVETLPPETVPSTEPAAYTGGFSGVIYSKNGITLTANGFDNTFFDHAISFTLENKSDRDVTVSTDQFLVNDILTMGGGLYIDASAGETLTDVLYLDETEAQYAGLEKLVSIAAYLDIYDSDSYEDIDQVVMQLASDEAATYEQPLDLSIGVLLFEQDGISIYARSIDEAYYGPSLVMLVVNETEREIFLSTDEVNVDGSTVDTWAYEYVFPGSAHYYTLDLDTADLEANGITYESMASMIFSAEIIDFETYETILETGDMEVTFINE